MGNLWAPSSAGAFPPSFGSALVRRGAARAVSKQLGPSPPKDIKPRPPPEKRGEDPSRVFGSKTRRLTGAGSFASHDIDERLVQTGPNLAGQAYPLGHWGS